MNRAAFNLAERSSEAPYKREDLEAERSKNKEVILHRKGSWLLQSHFPLGDGRGLSER